MNPWLMALVLALALAGLAVTAVLLVRDRPAQDATFALLGLTELVVVVQAVVGCVLLAGTERDVDQVSFVSYLLGAAVALPVGAFWSLAERTRSGTAVLAVALLTLVALEVRLDSIWGAGG